MKYDFAMENCLGTDYPNLHELNKNCYGFSPASVQNGPQAAAAAAAADEQTMYKVTITMTNIIILVKTYRPHPTTETLESRHLPATAPGVQQNNIRLTTTIAAVLAVHFF